MPETKHSVRFIVEVAIEEVEKDVHYRGRIDRFATPMTFDLTFRVPLAQLEAEVRRGKAFGFSDAVIASWVRAKLFGSFKLEIRAADEREIRVPSATLEEAFFPAISMVLGILQSRRVTKGSYLIPFVDEDEQEQFASPAELQQYVLELNKDR